MHSLVLRILEKEKCSYYYKEYIEHLSLKGWIWSKYILYKCENRIMKCIEIILKGGKVIRKSNRGVNVIKYITHMNKNNTINSTVEKKVI